MGQSQFPWTTVWSKRTIPPVKYEFSTKNNKVPFEEVIVKKDFVLGLFDQNAFLKEKSIFLSHH